MAISSGSDGRGLVAVQRRHARSSVIERISESEQFALSFDSTDESHLVVGDEALRVAARLMPTVNRFGGSTKQVSSAVDLLEEAGDPLRVLRILQLRFGGSDAEHRSVSNWNRAFSSERPQDRGTLRNLAPRDRLALEMALHEESERRAMDGELAALETAWREAEEIAKIADNMFVWPSVDAKLEELRLRADR